jgi:hypothetical protein
VLYRIMECIFRCGIWVRTIAKADGKVKRRTLRSGRMGKKSGNINVRGKGALPAITLLNAIIR